MVLVRLVVGHWAAFCFGNGYFGCDLSVTEWRRGRTRDEDELMTSGRREE